MKFTLRIVGALLMLSPFSAQAEVMLALNARIVPQCSVIAVDTVSGTTDVIVRTACNVERFQLTIEKPGGTSIAFASADNAAVSTKLGG